MYVCIYCVKSEMKMMQYECTKLIFPSFNQSVEFGVSLNDIHLFTSVIRKIDGKINLSKK